VKGSAYASVSGTVFGLVATLQLIRAVLQVPVQIGTLQIPVWFSWVAAFVVGGLCVWGFRTARPARG